MDVTQQEKMDWLPVLVWIGIITFVIIFWAAVGFGIARALGASWPQSPPGYTCEYSGVEMHQHFGSSSANCAPTP